MGTFAGGLNGGFPQILFEQFQRVGDQAFARSRVPRAAEGEDMQAYMNAISVGMLMIALAASGLLWPHEVGGTHLYSEADVRFVRNVLALLGVGLSLDDFLRIAHPLMAATGALGRDAVAEWDELVGTRIRESRTHGDDAGDARPVPDAGVPDARVADVQVADRKVESLRGFEIQ